MGDQGNGRIVYRTDTKSTYGSSDDEHLGRLGERADQRSRDEDGKTSQEDRFGREYCTDLAETLFPKD